MSDLEFRPSPIHGRGGFAARPVLPGERVIEYVGEKISKAESLQRCTDGNEFIFYLDEETDLDGNVEWNQARWINHSCMPNCVAELVDGRIWIVAQRAIPPGEEITFNYGYDLEDYREHPCRCGTAHCAGFIVAEEHFLLLRQKAAQRM